MKISITKIVGNVCIERFKHFNVKFVHLREKKFQSRKIVGNICIEGFKYFNVKFPYSRGLKYFIKLQDGSTPD